jgi:hypothetical protein
MDYKIVNFIAGEGKIEVFYSEQFPPLPIDVPLNDDGLFITGQELHQYIEGFIPTWHLERIAKLKAGIPNASELAALVEAVPPVSANPEDLLMAEEARRNSEMWAQLEFETQIAKVLVKLGVLESDPTTIPVNEA